MFTKDLRTDHSSVTSASSGLEPRQIYLLINDLTPDCGFTNALYVITRLLIREVYGVTWLLTLMRNRSLANSAITEGSGNLLSLDT